MLLNATKESLGDVDGDDTDNTSRFERVISSSLHGLSRILADFSPSDVDAIGHPLDEIFASSRFWKLAKGNGSLVVSGQSRL